jgi:hypothetical protein
LPDLSDHINNQQADIIVLRVTLQTLFIRMISAREDFAEEMLNDLKQAATSALTRLELPDETPETSAHAKELVRERADQFFGEIAQTLSLVRTKRGQSGRN